MHVVHIALAAYVLIPLYVLTLFWHNGCEVHMLDYWQHTQEFKAHEYCVTFLGRHVILSASCGLAENQPLLIPQLKKGLAV